MEKRLIRNFFIGLSISLAVDLIGVLILFYFLFTPTYIQNNNVIEKCDIFQEIQKSMDDVSSHLYIPDTYDCSQFSIALIEELKIKNISSYCVYGGYRVNVTSSYLAHEWVEVVINNQTYPLEAVGGYFIDNKTYSDLYDIRLKGICY